MKTTPPSLATGGVVSISELCSLIYRKLVARPSDAADLEYSQKLESKIYARQMALNIPVDGANMKAVVENV